MRIGFVGNQNNYPFMLARGLQRRGHDVRFVIDQQHRLDRPEYRYDDVPYPYPGWIREVESVQMVDVVFGTPRWQAALDAVGDCDALVLNKWGYDAATRLDKPAFCLTTGGDVEFWSNPDATDAFASVIGEQPHGRDWMRRALSLDRLDPLSILDVLDRSPDVVRREVYRRLFRMFVARQRRGLERAVGVSSLPPGVSAALSKVLADCISKDVPHLHLLMADLARIVPQPPPKNDTLRVFNAARVLWKRPFPPMVGDWEDKGTDILLKGAALWNQRTGRSIDVRLVEKGFSVPATKRLVDELGINALVSWQPELTQSEVFCEYAGADIVAEQCGTHVLGMAGYEAMAAGRPVIANGRPDLYATIHPGPPPVAQASTPEEVAAQLDRLSDPNERARIGAAGRRFVEEHLSVDAAAEQVETVLQQAIRACKN